MLRPLIALALLLSLSCSDQEPPVAPSAFDEEAGPWQTISINDVPYRRAAAKANATAQSSDLLISIPVHYIDGQISIPDTVVIEGRIYRASCSAPGNLPPVTDDDPSVSLNPDRAVLMVFYTATGGGSTWHGDNWGSDEPIGTWEGVTTNAEGGVTSLELPKSQLSGGESKLSGFIPAELGQLTNLEELILSRNELSGSIPAELGQLANLTLLVLSRNELSGSIPAELGQLTNLEWLFLSRNGLLISAFLKE